ncbi:glycosyltransferase family 1 protein [Geothermobacter hydrogeniphilus]|uniref:Uncharacterized protein n=1 Tax=Geothermobacter hydrogeniphilus TaxID=1969733 RepID=A0A1X0YE90_9BACT|nr:glycosyltransferase family 1 protein [Geothermobacter hydrogeniphilus]ORJ63403.1 hypothetical protein B5V00_00625 [Geothermobacter hydrogeniphilus]
MMENGKKIWITWEHQRRSIVLSKEFGCKLYIYDKNYSNKALRYLSAILFTFIVVIRNRPEIIFCQNPSVVLAFQLSLLKTFFTYKLIVDRHSNFMFNLEDSFKKKIFTIVSDYSIRVADLTIVTNEFLKNNYIENKNGRGVVLQDKIPDMGKILKETDRSRKTVFFITSFSRDEPILEVLEAIDGLGSEYYFYFSGDYKKLNEDIPVKGVNYEFTGFIDEDKFCSVLDSSHAVMVFTKHEHTLTCGAYEGLAKGKPLILSNTKAIKDYFKSGSVYCDMNSASIKRGIVECFENYSELKMQVLELRLELEKSWNEKFNDIRTSIFQ